VACPLSSRYQLRVVILQFDRIDRITGFLELSEQLFAALRSSTLAFADGFLEAGFLRVDHTLTLFHDAVSPVNDLGFEVHTLFPDLFAEFTA